MMKASKFWLSLGDRATNVVFNAIIGALKLLPYPQRLALMSWVTRRIIGPLIGYRRRTLDNLALIYPDMPIARRREIAEDVLDNVGRTIIENYSAEEFRARMAHFKIEGEGFEAAKKARSEGRAIIFSSGHWSNHEAAPMALDMAGFRMCGIYKPMANPYFNARYEARMAQVSGPIYPIGAKGTRDFMAYIRDGGHGYLLHDVYYDRGEWIDFLGKPAKTAISAAEIALRYDALLMPYFTTRQADGISFKIELYAPITPSDPITMTRDLVRHLDEKVAENPGQWLWIHRRWKGAPAE
ncbi:MAG: lauroyl acyltransferase [Pseudomonadota bacterium]